VRDIDISLLISKIRYVVKIYEEISAPNDIKDSVMIDKITNLRYVQSSNLREDVSRLMSQYDRYDAEMQSSQRQPVSQKKKFFRKITIWSFSNISSYSSASVASSS